MAADTWRRLVLGGLSCVLAGTVGVFAYFLHQSYQEYRGFRDREAAHEIRLEQLKGEIVRKERYLDRLQNDPFFLERVVRERLGYTKPEDLLYRFPQGSD